MLNLKTGDFKKFVQEKDMELYLKTKIFSILHSCKVPIRKIMRNKNELLLKNTCTLKRDLYKEEQDFIENKKYEKEIKKDSK